MGLGCFSPRPSSIEPLDVGLARDIHAQALVAAIWADDLESPGSLRKAAEAALAAPPGSDPPRAVDVMLDGFATRLTEGYPAAAATLVRALELMVALSVGTDLEARRWLWIGGGRSSQILALELWDAESWHALAAGPVRVARETGALVALQFALTFLAVSHVVAGELARRRA